MFSHLPLRQRVLIRVTLSSTWAAAGLGGLASLVLTPLYPLTALSVTGTIAGFMLAGAALAAGLGVAINRYRIEWVSSWLSATALSPYILVYWYSVFSVDWDRMASAFLLTSLLGFFMTRAYLCSAHAEKLRLEGLRLLHEGESGDG